MPVIRRQQPRQTQPHDAAALTAFGRAFEWVVMPTQPTINRGSAGAAVNPLDSTFPGAAFGRVIRSGGNTAKRIVLGSGTVSFTSCAGVVAFDRGTGTQQGLFCSSGLAAGGFKMRVDTGGTVSAQRSGVANLLTSSATVNTSGFNIVAWSFVSATRVAFALNGTLSTASTASVPTTSAAEFASGDNSADFGTYFAAVRAAPIADDLLIRISRGQSALWSHFFEPQSIGIGFDAAASAAAFKPWFRRPPSFIHGSGVR